MIDFSTHRRPAKVDVHDAMAVELRRMIVRCTNCTVLVMCEPCHTADRLLALDDQADA